MLVKEVIKKASTLIDREDLVEYLDGKNYTSTTIKKTVDLMVRLLNMVVSELASSFIPMVRVEHCVAQNGKINYSDLAFSPKQILKAFDVMGQDKLLSVEHTFVRVGATNVDLEYSYFPPDLDINGQIGYEQKDVTSNALAYGLLAEYSITQGCFKDAVMWHDRYADAINEQYKPKNVIIKRRNWL